MKQPLVSICCAAYNHEEYIEETLKGFLVQECDFDYEILIHDDASTDKTASIIKKYEKLYPDKIFPIYQTENQYSQGKKYSDLNYERARGKYIAICEGDDCWIDKTKLSKQIRLMEANTKHGLCFHPAKQLNLTNNTEKTIGKYLENDGIVPIEDIIIKPYGMIPYASCVVKKSVFDKVLDFKSTRPYLTLGDIYVQIFGSLDGGGALFINEVMSLYRYMTPSSWSEEWAKSQERQFNHVHAMAKSFEDLDAISQYKYSDAFKLSIIKKLFVLPSSNNLENIPKHFQNYTEKLLKVLAKLKESKEQYVLYGAGASSELLTHHLANQVECILDSDPKKENTFLSNKQVFGLNKIPEIKNKKIILSIIMRSDDAINTLIAQYKIPPHQIIKLESLLME